MIKLKLWILLLLGVHATVFAQKKSGGEAPDDDIKKYLKDGRVGYVNNLIRIRFNPILQGYPGLSYETKLTKHFSLEGGLYVKAFGFGGWDNINMEYSDKSSDRFSLNQVNSGTYILISPKYCYSSYKGMNKVRYIGLRTGFKTFKAVIEDSDYGIETQNVSASEIPLLFIMGSHRQFGSRFTLGMELGVGGRKYTYRNVKFGTPDPDINNNKPIVRTKDLSFIAPAMMFDVSFGVLF